MSSILLDTHVWAWSFMGSGRLSDRARAAMEEADELVVSPISFYEIAQKVRLRRWPEMDAFFDRLPILVQTQGARVAEFGPSICLEAGSMDWTHRDPFDRMIAATARQGGMTLVSADAAFDRVVARVW